MQDREETKTEGTARHLNSTLTLGFVPLQKNGRVRARDGKGCFSKRLIGSVPASAQYPEIARCAK